MLYFNKIIPYLLVFIIIFSTGATWYLINYTSLLIVFNIFIITILLFNLKSIKFNKLNLCLFFFISSFLLFSAVVNRDTDFSHYIGVILIFLLVFLVSSILRKEIFFNYYINIMIIVALTSLLFYIVGIVNEDFVNSFTTINLEGRVLYKNIYFYTYRYSPLAITQTAYLKNNSFFWEPGAYQAFLNIGLMMEYKKNGYKRAWIIILFIVTIMTTFSTSGYFLLLMFLISSLNFKKLNKITLITLGIILLIIGFCLLNFNIFFSKFNSNSSSYISFYHRQLGMIQDLRIWDNNLFLGVGYTNYNLLQSIGSANSITATLSKYGILLTSSVVILNILFIRKVSCNIIQFIFYCLAFIVIYGTENFFLTPLFLIIGFYSLKMFYK